MSTTPNRTLRLLPFALFFVFLGVMIWVGSQYAAQMEAFVFDNAGRVATWVSANVLLYCVAFVLLYTLATVFGLPISVVLSLGGAAVLSLAFGFWPATLLSTLLVWMSVVGGSWGLFEFVRRFGASAFDSLIGPYLDTFREGFGQDQFFYMLASRFTPLPPAVMTVVPAVLHANRGSFLLAAGIGFLPGVFVYASLGATLGQLIADAQTGLSFGDVVTLQNTWPLLALLALSLIPLIVRNLQRRKASS